jgi:plastocyanin
MKRAAIALALFLCSTLAFTGCGSKSKTNTATATADNCTAANATAERQDFITNDKFDVQCVKASLNQPFYFINNDDAEHTITTASGSPDMFDADLPKKTSTFTETFTKAGTYHIYCKRHGEKMTVIVADSATSTTAAK